jgi:hypothetical protein
VGPRPFHFDIHAVERGLLPTPLPLACHAR